MTEETKSVNSFGVLYESVNGQQCNVDPVFNFKENDCRRDDETFLLEDASQDTDLDMSEHELGAKVKKKVSFSDQVLIYELKKEYKCYKCSKSYKDYLTLRRHIKSKHKKQKHYICYYCAKKFMHRDVFKIHIKLHCDVCSLFLPNRFQYLEHKHVCGIIGKHNITAEKRKITMVLEENTSDQLSKFNGCELCKKQFGSKCALKYHISNSHLNESVIELKIDSQSDVVTYRCPYCIESSVCQDEIEKHLEILPDLSKNINTKELVYACNVCSEKFKTEDCLLKHKESHNMVLQDDDLQMDTADASSMNSFPDNSLNIMIDISTGVPDHFNPRVLLERLDVSLFESKNSNVNYKLRSDNEKGTVVHELIEDTSSDFSEVTKNSEMDELKEKKNQCTICQKFYCSSYSLQRHLKTHKKIYEKCIFCGMAFKTRHKLNEHKCNKIPEIPAADERTVVSIDDLNKSSSMSEKCTETTKTTPNKNKPIIVEVKSLNASYNILQQIEAIKINKFNVKNEIPQFFQPKILVEKLEFGSLLNVNDTSELSDDVIEIVGSEDTVMPCSQKSSKTSSTGKNICDDNNKEGNTSKPYVGSIRVIKNTTANFIDTMDYQDVYLKSVGRWDNKSEYLLSGNPIDSLSRHVNSSDIQTYKAKRVTTNKPLGNGDDCTSNDESRDITDDIPITILKKVNASSILDSIQSPNTGSSVSSNLLTKRHNILPGQPRLLNHELSDPPNLTLLQRDGENNGQIKPGEVFQLQPASMFILTNSNNMQLQPGYLVRMKNGIPALVDSQNEQPDVVPTMNRTIDRNTTPNGVTALNSPPNSNRVSQGPDEISEKNDNPILQNLLGRNDSSIVDPLLNCTPLVVSDSDEPISVTRTSIESIPEMTINNGSQSVVGNICPPLVTSNQSYNNVTSGSSIGAGVNVNDNASRVAQGSTNSSLPRQENITSIITMLDDCQICGRYFHSKSSLTLHLRKMHKLAKNYSPLPFTCNVCQEAFVKLYSLERHKCSGLYSNNRAQYSHNETTVESQNSVNNVAVHTFVDLTENHNTQYNGVSNGMQFPNGNRQMPVLDSIDVEAPIVSGLPRIGGVNATDLIEMQPPPVSTSTYDFDNYKLVLTEVPIEF